MNTKNIVRLRDTREYGVIVGVSRTQVKIMMYTGNDESEKVCAPILELPISDVVLIEDRLN